MIRLTRSVFFVFVTVACLGGIACQLRRPHTTPLRMVEPQLLEPQQPDPALKVNKAPSAVPVRLLETQTRGHIGRRVLHQQPEGELIEDAVWLWSSAPDRYLDTALQLQAASSSNVRLVDSGASRSLGATLLVWDIESAGGKSKLVGVVEYQLTGSDRVVHTQLVQASEPVSPDLPGDLGAAAGRLLRRLASEGLALVANPQ